MIWTYDKGSLKTVGITLYVDRIVDYKNDYGLFKDEKIGELKKSAHYIERRY